MIFSGALCGQLADRFGRADLILTVCLVGGMVSFALLPEAGWAIATSLAYGLIGVAPAGLIVALTAEAMAPHKRAFGMGVYQSLFSILTAAAPAVAGWLFDRTGEPYVAILFGIALMAVTLAAYYSFRWCSAAPAASTSTRRHGGLRRSLTRLRIMTSMGLPAVNLVNPVIRHEGTAVRFRLGRHRRPLCELFGNALADRLLAFCRQPACWFVGGCLWPASFLNRNDFSGLVAASELPKYGMICGRCC
jgi:MFS family permease